MSEYHPGQGFGQPGPYNQPPQYGQGFGPNPNVYSPNPAMYGQGFNQTPGFGGNSGWDTSPVGNQYQPPAAVGSWDTQPVSGFGANQYTAPQVPEAPQRESLLARAKRKLGGNASYGIVDAAPDVTPSPWDGASSESGFGVFSPAPSGSAEQSGWGAPVSSSFGNQYQPPAATGGWNTQPQSMNQGQSSGGWRDRLPSTVANGVERGREFMATPAGHMLGDVATTAAIAGFNEFGSNYGVQRTEQGWDVNKRRLVTGVAKTAFSPTSTARVVNQGRKAAKAAKDAGRAQAQQQARDAIQRAW